MPAERKKVKKKRGGPNGESPQNECVLAKRGTAVKEKLHRANHRAEKKRRGSTAKGSAHPREMKRAGVIKRAPGNVNTRRTRKENANRSEIQYKKEKTN